MAQFRRRLTHGLDRGRGAPGAEARERDRFRGNWRVRDFGPWSAGTTRAGAGHGYERIVRAAPGPRRGQEEQSLCHLPLPSR